MSAIAPGEVGLGSSVAVSDNSHPSAIHTAILYVSPSSMQHGLVGERGFVHIKHPLPSCTSADHPKDACHAADDYTRRLFHHILLEAERLSDAGSACQDGCPTASALLRPSSLSLSSSTVSSTGSSRLTPPSIYLISTGTLSAAWSFLIGQQEHGLPNPLTNVIVIVDLTEFTPSHAEPLAEFSERVNYLAASQTHSDMQFSASKCATPLVSRYFVLVNEKSPLVNKTHQDQAAGTANEPPCWKKWVLHHASPDELVVPKTFASASSRVFPRFSSATVTRPSTPEKLSSLLIRLASAAKAEYSGMTSIIRMEQANHSHRRPAFSPKWAIDALNRCFQEPPEGVTFPASIQTSQPPSNPDWNKLGFTSLDMSREELLHLIMHMFTSLNLLGPLEVAIDEFKNFLVAVFHNYLPNPYHNMYHAVDVLQCTFLILSKATHLAEVLSTIHMFALLIAALCHDMGHPSFSNQFLVETASPMSLIFNDRSILENYHSMLLFALLQVDKFNFGRHWSRELMREFRGVVIGCVLATDMSNHFDFVTRFCTAFPLETTEASCPPVPSAATGIAMGANPISSTEKLQVCIAIIKCADISNVIRPFPIARRWGIRLIGEFWLQALQFSAVSPMNDRSFDSINEGQVRFLSTIAAPLYTAVADRIEGLEFFRSQLKDNLAAWNSCGPVRPDGHYTDCNDSINEPSA